MYDVIIIGAGVSGTFIARELSAYKLKVLVVDKENDVGNLTTSANSAIIHAGYDAKAGKKKGIFNAAGNKLYPKICEDLDVEFDMCGSFVIGFGDEDDQTIRGLYENGLKNDVEKMKILSKEEILEMEPNLSHDVTTALYAGTAGIISPFELAIALAENAIDNGVEISLETYVDNIKIHPEHYEILTNKGSFEGKYLINCAGVHADKISDMVVEPYFKINPRKGNYFVMDLSEGDLVKHVIFQCPSSKGKGVLVTPTVHGNLLVGPDSEYVDEKSDTATDANRLNYIKETAFKTTDKLNFAKVIRVFAGLRATGDTGDFIIEHVAGTRGFINVAAYESPGLSSAPAVALHIVDIIKDLNGGLEKNESFNPKRRPVVRFRHCSDEKKADLIRENSKYARVICRCETVTEAEIVDCIHRNAGARSIKAVKKRVRPGAGRCQGGFCSPRVQEILARELGKDMLDIPYDTSKGYILTENMNEMGEN